MLPLALFYAASLAIVVLIYATARPGFEDATGFHRGKPSDNPRRDDAERLGCASCGQPDCDCSDPEYAGVTPALNTLFHEKVFARG